MPTPKLSEIDTWFQQAELFRASGKKEDALKEYSKVVFFAPSHWPAYFHLGVLLGEAGHHELAVAMLRRSEAFNPDNAVIKNHIADYLTLLGRIEEARQSLEKSWALDSSYGNISAQLKIGTLLRESNRPEEALPYFQRVIDQKGDGTQEAIDRYHVACWFRGLCHYALNDYQAAWPDYEKRNGIPGVIVPRLDGELWQGQPLEGKTIFLTYEQRFGDFLQFVRFLPCLTDMGARVIVQTPPELARQMKQSFPKVELAPAGGAIPAYDYHHFITSIPAVLNMSKDDIARSACTYLDVADEDRVTDLPARPETSLKVGLVWEGQPDPPRSIPLAHYIPLLKHGEVSFYSFQLGQQQKHLYQQAVSWLVHDLSPRITDFYQSSALLKEMDLLITIDTAIAHQAGALGMPVWLMIRNFADWRWNDNSWYPSMRIFRQKHKDSWDEAAHEMQAAFAEWVVTAKKKKSSKRAK